MADFAQTGLICTLQRLNETHLDRLEAELFTLAAERPISLVLPCYAAELDGAALPRLCAELAGASWLREVIVSMNGLDQPGFARASALFASVPNSRILWNDGPRLAPLHASLLGCTPEALPHGKGLNVWAAIGVITAEAKSEIVVTQDCDVASFQRVNLARLCFACSHPELQFSFAKMYYSRVTDRLYGRVTRLFLAPLLQACVRVAGHQPLLDFLLSFRYPLAGECAGRRELAASLPMSAGWGLEIGQLAELFRQLDPRAVCQVDGGSGYDHKHQPVMGGLVSMCREIADTLFSQLATEGFAATPALREAIAGAYRRESALALQRSAALALINGIPFDRAHEENITAAFASVLEEPGSDTPFTVLPAWSRLARDKAQAVSALACSLVP
jgi:glucosyl-3-phosphoglycerate synthase